VHTVNVAAIFRFRVSDRKTEQVESLSQVRLMPGNCWIWSGVTPDSFPLVLQDIHTQEIYALNWEAP